MMKITGEADSLSFSQKCVGTKEIEGGGGKEGN